MVHCFIKMLVVVSASAPCYEVLVEESRHAVEKINETLDYGSTPDAFQ